MANSIYPESVIQQVLDTIDAMELLRAIDYRVDKVECTKPFEFRSFCPIHKETIFRTLTLNDHTKHYLCSYNFCQGARGGDFIDLYARSLNLGYDEALRILATKFAPDLQLPDSERHTTKQLEVAHNYLELNVLDEAIAAYRRVLDFDPFSIEAHEGLALAFSQAGDSEQLRAELGMLLEIYSSSGAHEQVVRVASRLVDLDPEDPDNYNILVQSLRNLGDHAAAVAWQQQHAFLLKRQGHYEEALEIFQTLESDPATDVRLPLEAVECMLFAGRREQGIDRARELEKFYREQTQPEMLRQLLLLLAGQGVADRKQRNALIQDIERHGVTSEGIASLLRGAEHYVEQSEEEAAFEILSALEVRARGSAPFLEGKARVLRHLGRDDEAQEAELALIDRLIHDDELDEATRRVDHILAHDLGNVAAMKRQVDICERRGETDAAIDMCWQIIEELKLGQEVGDALPIYEKLTIFDPDNAELRQEFICALADAGRPREAGLAAVMFAEELIDSGREDEARRRLETLCDRLPQSVEVRQKLGTLHAERNDGERAAELFGQGANIAAAKEDKRTALALLRRAVRMAPEEPRWFAEIARLYHDQGQSHEAADAYRRLGELHLEREQFEEAEAAITRAFELQPEDTASLRAMARLYRARRDEGSQIRTMLKLAEISLKNLDFQRVIETAGDIERLDQGNIEAQKLRIEAYRRTKQTTLAVNAMSDLGEQLEGTDREQDAENLYREILRLDATNLEVRERLVRLLLKHEKLDEASREGARAIDANRRLARYNHADELISDILARIPRDRLVRESAYSLEREAGDRKAARVHAEVLADLYREAGEFEPTVRIYRELLEDDPENTEVRSRLIEALRGADEVKEATVQSLRLARDYRKSGRLVDAIPWYRAVLESEPENEAAMIELASSLADTGDREAAVELYAKLARRYRSEARTNEAAILIQRALKIDKKNIELRRCAIELALEEQDIDDAVAAYIQLYEVYRVEQQRTKALEVIREAVGVKPDNPQLRTYLIEELREAGQEAEAAEAEVELLKIQIRSGNRGAAVALLDELSARETPPPDLNEARRLLDETESVAGTNGKSGIEKPGEDTRRGERVYRRLGPKPEPAQLLTMPDFTFENFVVGDENEFAHATALAIAKDPGKDYNPVFFWGDVGLGKTHLVNAIANEFAEKNPEISVIYTSTDEFISRLIEAIQSNAVTAFRNEFRACDMLLIDDIQFLSGKERAQEEFFHIFNVLFQSKRQIVLTSDRPPKSIAHLEDRLLSRFGAGVIIEIKAPGVETRMAIVKREVLHRGLNVDDDVLSLIVDRVEGSVRELKGAVNQICAMAEIGGDYVTLETARKVLDTLYAQA